MGSEDGKASIFKGSVFKSNGDDFYFSVDGVEFVGMLNAMVIEPFSFKEKLAEMVGMGFRQMGLVDFCFEDATLETGSASPSFDLSLKPDVHHTYYTTSLPTCINI